MAVNGTAVWRVGPSGANANGAGYDPAYAGGTDFSQQNAAQASGTNGAGSATTTFTDSTANAFTSAMVGNAVNISGQGFYFVIAFISASQVTVDRALGTFSGASWKLGGRWADFWTNTTSTGPLVYGNVVNILGSGTPNPASYTYDYTATSFTPPAGVHCFFVNDPATPGYKVPPDTTGGMPVIKFTGAQIFACQSNTQINLQGLWFVGASGIAAGSSVTTTQSSTTSAIVLIYGCVLDQFAFDISLLASITSATNGGTSFCHVQGCEVFSSQGGTGGTRASIISPDGISNSNVSFVAIGNNIHDCVGYGIYYSTGSGFSATFCLIVEDNIIAKCSNSGIYIDSFSNTVIKNNTIDGNGGDGIHAGTLENWEPEYIVFNNIISNHTGVGKFGINAGNGGDGTKGLVDFNTYYNNTADLKNISYGPHDTHGGTTSPYVGQSTENYALA